MESRLTEWQRELDELSEYFKKLCKSRKKSLAKEEDALVIYVANKQLELVKRVNFVHKINLVNIKTNIACRVNCCISICAVIHVGFCLFKFICLADI